MLAVSDIFDQVRGFFELGGQVLWAILFVSVLLWMLILERYIYMRFAYPKEMKAALEHWKNRKDKVSRRSIDIRDASISVIKVQLNKSLVLIGALISICPLLGLLGTVTGMIHVFDVMAILGNGNPRAMASGVSLATIPTMAGLVTALSALYFHMHLKQRVRRETEKVKDLFGNPD